MRRQRLKKALLVCLALVACAPAPVGDMSTHATDGDQIAMYESSGSTGGTAGDESGDSSGEGWIEKPDAGAPVEEGKWGWNQADCFTLNDDFVSCQYFCQHEMLGDCLAIETFEDECGDHLTGTKVVGWCDRDPFSSWPNADVLQVRCMCHM